MGKIGALLQELRRRRVFRVTLIYGAGAVGLISACDWIFPQIPQLVADPEGGLRWVIIASLANLPAALIFGWLYDITAEGIQRTPAFSEVVRDPDATLHRADRWVIGSLSLAMLSVAAFAVLRIAELEPPASTSAALPAEPVVLDEMALAILPLVDRSVAGENAEILAFGVHDTLLTLVSRINALRVISRTTMEQYKDTSKTLPQIAAELGVANFLEGSVQRSGDQVRITVQLIRAPGDEHLWAETYDRALTASNLFQVQSEIANAVAGKLAIMLKPEELQAFATVAAAVPTQNTDALTAYMLGRMRLRDRKVDGLAQAVEQFALAIELDPNYAAAYAGLVDACYLYGGYSGGRRNERCPNDLESLARKALALDDTVGEAWISLGEMLKLSWWVGGQDKDLLQEAKAAFERGLDLSPSFSQGYHWYALLLSPNIIYDSQDEWFEAWEQRVWLRLVERGLEVDPLSVPLHFMASIFPKYARNPDEAMWHARRIIEIAPESPRGYDRLAELSWALRGRVDEGIRWHSKAAQTDPRQSDFFDSIGLAYSALGDFDKALEYFARARQLLPPGEAWGIDEIRASEALTLLFAGREQEAEPLLDSLLESPNPESRATALALLARTDLDRGRPDKALDRYQQKAPECFESETRDELPGDCPARGEDLVRLMQAAGDHDRARRWLAPLHSELAPWVAHPGAMLDQQVAIREAQLLALDGQAANALAALERAVSLNWRGNLYQGPPDWRYYEKYDLSLDSIRGNPRFKAAFAIIKAHMDRQLVSVREMERNGQIVSLGFIASQPAKPTVP